MSKSRNYNQKRLNYSSLWRFLLIAVVALVILGLLKYINYYWSAQLRWNDYIDNDFLSRLLWGGSVLVISVFIFRVPLQSILMQTNHRTLIVLAATTMLTWVLILFKYNVPVSAVPQKIFSQFPVVVSEEIIFRGLLLTQLVLFFGKRKWVGVIAAVIISSAYFSAIHFYQQRGPVIGFYLDTSLFVYLFIFSVLVSGVYLKTGNIFFAMYFHLFYNLTDKSLFPHTGTLNPYFGFVEFLILLFMLVIIIWPGRQRTPDREPRRESL